MKRANEMSPAPIHHQKGGFRNPWPHAQPKGFGAVLKWAITRSRARPDKVRNFPARSTPSTRVSIPDRSRDSAITWLGHSSFLIQCDGLNILTDPIWSARASPVSFAGPRRLVPVPIPLDRLPPIDITLISHDHYDHLDDTTIRRLISRYPRMRWCVPLAVGAFLKERGALHVSELDWWDEAEVLGITVGCTPAQHFSGRYPWNRNSTLWCGWTLAFARSKVFFAGDTALHPEFAEISKRFGPFDMAILPIGAYEPRWFMRPVHMNPEDSVRAFQQLTSGDSSASSVMVGSHWGTFRLTDEPVIEPPVLTRVLWGEAGLDPTRLWIMQHGETRHVLKQD